MPGENIQDELRTINDAPIHTPFQIALLYGTELAIEDDQRRLPRLSFGTDLVQFASAHHRRRINRVAHLKDTASDNGAGTAR
jgi:hypothetical protein